MNGELSEGLTVTISVYTPELLAVSGWNFKLVEYGGEVVSCEVLLPDHTPKIVTFVSTLGSSSTVPVSVKIVPLYGRVEGLMIETSGSGTEKLMLMQQTMYLTKKYYYYILYVLLVT